MDDLPSLPLLLAAIAVGLAPAILILSTGVIGRVLRAAIGARCISYIIPRNSDFSGGGEASWWGADVSPRRVPTPG
jgi:hypothetical protein